MNKVFKLHASPYVSILMVGNSVRDRAIRERFISLWGVKKPSIKKGCHTIHYDKIICNLWASHTDLTNSNRLFLSNIDLSIIFCNENITIDEFNLYLLQRDALGKTGDCIVIQMTRGKTPLVDYCANKQIPYIASDIYETPKLMGLLEKISISIYNERKITINRQAAQLLQIGNRCRSCRD